MSILGTGVTPTGSIGSELTAVTRRAFIPKLVVQLYYSSPSLYFMMSGAQKAAGGIAQITVPLQGQSMVQGQFTGYAGGFNQPSVIPGIQNGQWNLAYWVVPIPLLLGESVLQSTEAVVPLLKARMNDAYAVTWQNMARLMYTNNTGNSQAPDSFYNAFDDGTNVPVYGGINRTAAGNSNFKGQYINAGAGSTWNTNYTTATTGWSRAAMAALLMKITDAAGGEAPTFVVMNPADYSTLNGNFIGNEQQFVMPGRQYDMNTEARSSFPNLNVSGVPIFADHFVQVGTMFAANVKYTSMFLSADAAFDFSGFYSLVPVNQIGQQGIVIVGYDVVSTKSVSGAFIYGFGGNAY